MKGAGEFYDVVKGTIGGRDLFYVYAQQRGLMLTAIGVADGDESLFALTPGIVGHVGVF